MDFKLNFMTSFKTSIQKELERIQLYNLPIHETVSFRIAKNDFQYTRVSGGWICIVFNKEEIFVCSHFIPYDDEFKPTKDEVIKFTKTIDQTFLDKKV